MIVLKRTLMFVTALVATILQLSAADKPNFIFIMADDVSPDRFGCYGSKRAVTPNIDALAESGVKFETCWATPMCGPTRALVMTGRYAYRNGIYHNSLWVPDAGNKYPVQKIAKNHRTFAQLLRDGGYATAIVGNAHTPGGNIYSGETGFDEHHVHSQFPKLPDGSVWDGANEGKYKIPNAYLVPSRYWHPCIIQNGKALPTTPEDYGPDLHADFIIDFMKRQQKANKPFMAYYPMSTPHNMASGGFPTTPSEERPGRNEGGNHQKTSDYADVVIGRIVKALEETGLRENTILIFTSDNGDWPHGKMWATEYGARVPMVINAPGLIETRGSTGALMELSDLLPTFLDYANIPLPEGYEVDGKSLKPFLSGKVDTHRDIIYSYIGTARMVRDSQWLIEGLDPLAGHPVGRMYYCGGNRSAKGYKEVTDSQSQEVSEARKRLMAYLGTIPYLDPENPEHTKRINKYIKGNVFPHRINVKK